MPSSAETGGALAGAAEGAAQGAVVGSVVPGIGTAVGAVVGGVIGAISGFFGGSSSDYKKKAEKTQQQMEKTRAALQRRDLILEGYIARAQSVNAAAAQDEGGGLQSSAPRGAISSIGSQLEFNTRYFGTQAALLDKRNKYVLKAGKYAQYAQNAQSILDVGSSLASLSSLYSTGPAPGAGAYSPGAGGVGPYLPPSK